MKPSPLDEALSSHPLLADLAARGRRRRAALERAEEECAEGEYVTEEAAELSTMRLAAADEPEATYAGDGVQVQLRGGYLTLVAGPGGLALREGGRTLALAAGVPVAFAAQVAPPSITLIDPRGRKLVLPRA